MLEVSLERVGLQMNLDKTKVMTDGKDAIRLGKKEIEKAKEYE